MTVRSCRPIHAKELSLVCAIGLFYSFTKYMFSGRIFYVFNYRSDIT